MMAPARRSLFGIEGGCRNAKVGSGGCLGTPDPIAPLDHVQIDFENSRGQGRLEAARDDELAQLAQGAARGRQVEILRQLLGNRAGAAERRPCSQLTRIDSRICSRSIPS